MAARAGIHDAMLFTVMGAAAVVAEAALMVALMRGTLPAGELVGGHAAVSATLILWAASVRRRRGDWRIPGIMAMATVFMGVVGSAGALLCLFLHAWYRRKALPFSKWYASLFPSIEDGATEDLRQSLGDPTESVDVAPFIDILRAGGTDQRLAVVALLARHFRPEFASALKLALRDENSAVRVQAANSAAQIEDRFSQQADRLAVAAHRRPDDVDAQLELARHYEEYADTGLLDDNRQGESFRTALETYLRAAELRPGDAAIMTAVGRLLLKEGRFAEAEPLLREATAAAAGAPRVVLLYMETLFRLGRWNDLRALSRRHAGAMNSDPDVPAEAVEAVVLWAAAEPSEAAEGVGS